jgi:nitrogen regulatory protein PII
MNTLLVLNISPELEEDLVDYLLQVEGVSGFTTQTVYGHGPEGAMTLAEQVAGRRKRLRIEILMREEDVANALAGLAAEVGRDIVYWQQPVSGFGRIG